MKELLKICMAAVMVAAMWHPTVATAQEQAPEERQRVELHKEAFFDIRVTENIQASNVAAEVANFMKTHDDVVITVVGYADRETGNPKLNVGYARERAERFRNDLIGRYGVDPARISVDSKGDRVQPFAENDLNRCVIINGYGYVRPTLESAQARADRQRQEYQEDRDERYRRERERYRTDTVFVNRTDTVWIEALADSLKPEQPFGLNKAHRWRNWFITFGGGPAIFQGDHNIDAVWKDRLYPAFDLSIGKWIYPALGLRAGVNLDVVHSYYNANPNNPNELAYKNGVEYYGEFVHGASPNEPYEKRPWLYRMDYNTWNFHFDVMVNLSAIMWKPYTRRIWNLIPYAGVGCIVTWDNGNHDWFNYATCWNVGVLNSFRVAEHIDINLDLRLKKFSDDFNCFRQGRDMDGTTNLMIGFTWYFTQRGF